MDPFQSTAEQSHFWASIPQIWDFWGYFDAFGVLKIFGGHRRTQKVHFWVGGGVEGRVTRGGGYIHPSHPTAEQSHFWASIPQIWDFLGYFGAFGVLKILGGSQKHPKTPFLGWGGVGGAQI